MSTTVAVIRPTPLATELLSRALLARRKEFVLVPCGNTPKQFLQQIAEKRPDVAVISKVVTAEPQPGVNIVRQVRQASPTTRTIMVVECRQPQEIVEAFSAGARGVLCESDTLETMCKCIRTVHAGQIWANTQEMEWIVKMLGEREPARMVSAKGLPLLTKQEEQVVQLVAEGMTNPEITAKLSISPHTLKNHLYHIYEKLGISNRSELILYAMSKKQGA